MFKRMMIIVIAVIIVIIVSLFVVNNGISIGKWSKVETTIGNHAVFRNGKEEVESVEYTKTHWEWYVIVK